MAEVTSRSKKRYALVGTGGRAIFFYTAIVKDYSEVADLVAFVDTNQTRMNYANSKLQTLGHPSVPTYLASDFDKMVEEETPDEIIVTTIDRTHNIYVSNSILWSLDQIVALMKLEWELMLTTKARSSAPWSLGVTLSPRSP
jgi:hypothetical protein